MKLCYSSYCGVENIVYRRARGKKKNTEIDDALYIYTQTIYWKISIFRLEEDKLHGILDI